MCLRFQFCPHQRVCILHFLKKSQIRCTLMRMGMRKEWGWDEDLDQEGDGDGMRI